MTILSETLVTYNANVWSFARMCQHVQLKTAALSELRATDKAGVCFVMRVSVFVSAEIAGRQKRL